MIAGTSLAGTFAVYRIAHAQFIAPAIKRFVVEAPRVAKKWSPGQFVIVRLHERGERIPLTVVEVNDPCLTLIVQTVGKTTEVMNRLGGGDSILNLVGPLGKPSRIKHYGTSVVVSGGVGAAIAYPVAKALKNAGNQVVSVLGAATQRRLILGESFQSISDQLVIVTDDGTEGKAGMVTRPLASIVAKGANYVFAAGPIPMMSKVAAMTKPYGIKTVASLNAMMVDGTGMCGGCRVLVNGTNRFACVDGPEFDAHQVDFTVLANRNRMYEKEERQAWAEYRKDSGREPLLYNNACALEAKHPMVGPLRSSEAPDER